MRVGGGGGGPGEGARWGEPGSPARRGGPRRGAGARARLCRGGEAGRRGLGCWGGGLGGAENGEQSGGAPPGPGPGAAGGGGGEGALTLRDRAGHGLVGGGGERMGVLLSVSQTKCHKELGPRQPRRRL